MKDSDKQSEVLCGPLGGFFRMTLCDGCKKAKTSIWTDEKGEAVHPGLKALCPACAEADTKRRKRQARERDFDAEAPSCFRNTDPERIPAGAALVEALRWKPSEESPFVILHGGPGRGKTRTAFILARRIYADSKRTAPTFVHSPAGGFAAGVVSAWREGGAEALISQYSRCDVLLFDDLDKEKLSPRAEEAFFAILNARTEAGLPIIITTNTTGDRMIERFSEEFRAPVLRRLEEFSTAIHFP